jgi:hypothetical protein
VHEFHRQQGSAYKAREQIALPGIMGDCHPGAEIIANTDLAGFIGRRPRMKRGVAPASLYRSSVAVAVMVMGGWQATRFELERGWFPRAVPPADGLRAVRRPGARPSGNETKRTGKNSVKKSKRSAAAADNDVGDLPQPLRNKPRFLLRQGCTDITLRRAAFFCALRIARTTKRTDPPQPKYNREAAKDA